MAERQVAEPPQGPHWGSNPGTHPATLALRQGPSSSLVLQVPVGGPEAETAAEEPCSGRHQVFPGENGQLPSHRSQEFPQPPGVL